jgi:hypothetical protein
MEDSIRSIYQSLDRIEHKLQDQEVVATRLENSMAKQFHIPTGLTDSNSRPDKRRLCVSGFGSVICTFTPSSSLFSRGRLEPTRYFHLYFPSFPLSHRRAPPPPSDKSLVHRDNNHRHHNLSAITVQPRILPTSQLQAQWLNKRPCPSRSMPRNLHSALH